MAVDQPCLQVGVFETSYRGTAGWGRKAVMYLGLIESADIGSLTLDKKVWRERVVLSIPSNATGCEDCEDCEDWTAHKEAGEEPAKVG